MRKTRESKSCEKKKTGNVRLVTKRDCWELISQNKDTRKKGKKKKKKKKKKERRKRKKGQRIV